MFSDRMMYKGRPVLRERPFEAQTVVKYNALSLGCVVGVGQRSSAGPGKACLRHPGPTLKLLEGSEHYCLLVKSK